MSEVASRWMKQAAMQLDAMDDTLDRARGGSVGAFQDEAAEIQKSVREAARRARDLAGRMKAEA